MFNISLWLSIWLPSPYTCMIQHGMFALTPAVNYNKLKPFNQFLLILAFNNPGNLQKIQNFLEITMKSE